MKLIIQDENGKTEWLGVATHIEVTPETVRGDSLAGRWLTSRTGRGMIKVEFEYTNGGKD